MDQSSACDEDSWWLKEHYSIGDANPPMARRQGKMSPILHTGMADQITIMFRLQTLVTQGTLLDRGHNPTWRWEGDSMWPSPNYFGTLAKP